jgi:nucleotide-binding universal stress UspA family protein
VEINGLQAGTIAVGVDGSMSSERALAFAIDQAAAERRPLTLVHAVGALERLWLDQNGHDNRIGAGAAETGSQRLLADARDKVARKDPRLDVHELLRVADPRDVLLDVARDASLLVVGSRGRGPVRSRLLGSVGVAVTRQATCPVVVVRPGNPARVRHGVLVGADGTQRSQAALDFAFREASLHRLPVTVLHAFWDLPSTIAAAHVADGEGEDLEAHRLLLAECVSGLQEKYPDVPVRTQLTRGRPDECLVRMAERMNMVVVGSHHGGAASEVLFGSVAASVVEHATCPVAVIPTGERG